MDIEFNENDHESNEIFHKRSKKCSFLTNKQSIYEMVILHEHYYFDPPK